jgi:hypothetical protein
MIESEVYFVYKLKAPYIQSLGVPHYAFKYMNLFFSFFLFLVVVFYFTV